MSLRLSHSLLRLLRCPYKHLSHSLLRQLRHRPLFRPLPLAYIPCLSFRLLALR